MKILFINHFAGIPQKFDAALRHFNIAKYQQKYNNKCSIITSSNTYWMGQDKQKIKTSQQKELDGIDYYFIDEFSPSKTNLFMKHLRMFSFSKNLFW